MSIAVICKYGGSLKIMYDSEERAAFVAATYMYDVAETYGIESGAFIYSVTQGIWTSYSYTDVVYGGPHGCDPKDAEKLVPSDAEIVAFIHTHPNSNQFSEADIGWAKWKMYNMYVVIPTHDVLKYDWCSKTVVSIGKMVPSPVTLTQDEVDTLKEAWYGHFVDGICPNGFDDTPSLAWPFR